MKEPSARARQGETARNAILDAAIPLFARGYDSVPISEIAAKSGYKQSLLMYHFGNKQSLWEQAAKRLFDRFDERYTSYLPGPTDTAVVNDRQLVKQHLSAFIKALRDIPEYGQILFSEGSHDSGRLQWLHENFFPSTVRQARFHNDRVRQAIRHTILLRNALAGAMLFNVVAGQQLARIAEKEGIPEARDLYPLSDAMADQLATMLTAFVFNHGRELHE